MGRTMQEDTGPMARTGSQRLRAVPRLQGSQFEAQLSAAQGGEAWALGELFGQYGCLLLGYFRGERVRDPDAAANETLLRVFRALDRFMGSEVEFRSWVFTIAHNYLVDERRKDARTPTLMLLESSNNMPADASDGGFEQAIRRLDTTRLLEILSDDQREVMLLRYVADLSIEDTADVLGKRAGAVKALQQRAIGRIRRELAK